MTRPTIIVIDDQRQLAEGIARHLRHATRLEVAAIDDPQQALEVVVAGGVKVAVLDQAMPKMSGVTLFRKMRETDPLIRGVMLTGEASASEVADAFESARFGAYVEKANYESQLAHRVFEQYVAYQAELELQRSQEPRVQLTSAKVGRLFRRNQIRYEIARFVVSDTLTVFRPTWKVDGTVKAGEQRTIRRSVQTTLRFRWEAEWNLKLTAGLGLDAKTLVGLTSKLEADVAERMLVEGGQEVTSAVEEELMIKLPDEPADPTEVRILSREYQSAPAYGRAQLLLAATCNCCNATRLAPLEAFQWTGKIASRQVEFWSDGTTRVVNTTANFEERDSP